MEYGIWEQVQVQESGPRETMDADAFCAGAACSLEEEHQQAPPKTNYIQVGMLTSVSLYVTCV